MNYEQQGGLYIPPGVGPGEQEISSMSNEWDTYDMSEAYLIDKSIYEVDMPRHERPSITLEVLASPNSKSYTELYLKIEAWHNYVCNVMAEIKARMVGYENEQDDIALHIRNDFARAASSGTKKTSVATINDAIESNPRFRELKLEIQKWEQRKILLSARLNSLEHDLKLVSRQVEIRRQDIDAGRVGGNMPGRGKRVGYGQQGGEDTE